MCGPVILGDALRLSSSNQKHPVTGLLRLFHDQCAGKSDGFWVNRHLLPSPLPRHVHFTLHVMNTGSQVLGCTGETET